VALRKLAVTLICYAIQYLEEDSPPISQNLLLGADVTPEII